jgi:acyl dehydratase
MEIGKTIEIKRVFTQQDIARFAAVSGDDNPVHLDADYAAYTLFKRPVVHGMLVGSLFSQLLGKHWPGPGSIYLSQTLKFLKPVFPGELLVARCSLESFDHEKHRGTFLTTIHLSSGDLAVTGYAVVLFPKDFQY